MEKNTRSSVFVAFFTMVSNTSNFDLNALPLNANFKRLWGLKTPFKNIVEKRTKYLIFSFFHNSFNPIHEKLTILATNVVCKCTQLIKLCSLVNITTLVGEGWCMLHTNYQQWKDSYPKSRLAKCMYTRSPIVCINFCIFALLWGNWVF